MTIATLIEEMQAVRQEYPTLTVTEVLTLFQIEALKKLTRAIRNG